jgi:outer membrane protein assembly factor BamB
VRWRASTGSAIDVPPTVAGGVVFTGSHDGGVHAYAASGCGASTCPALWSTSVGAAVSDQPMVDSGLLHVPTADGRLVTYRPATS